MKDSLREYRQGIIKAKQKSEKLLLIIPIIIGVLDSIAFIKTNLMQYFIFLFLNLLLIGFYLYIYDQIKNIEADNKYLDEDIIKLREISYNFEELHRSVKNSQANIIHFTPLMSALDYAIKTLDLLLFSKNKVTYKDFKDCIQNILYNTNKIIHHFYRHSEEYLTIALYYYCEPTGDLLDYASYVAQEEADIKPKGRIWHISDEAHICYAARHPDIDEFIFNDINKELAKPINANEDDELKYVSSLSVPIFDTTGTRVRAVLSLTSSEPNRFNKTDPENIIDNNINMILVRVFVSIAKILEICINKQYPDSDNEILTDIIKSYIEEITDINNNLSQLYEKLTK